MTAVGGVLLALLALVAGAVAQQRVDAVATIRGVVVTHSVPHSPITGAIVLVTRSEDGFVRAVPVDSDGRFEIAALTSGQYTLTARHPAYLETAFGATAWPGAGAALFVSDGQVRDDVVITMPKGGVIAGSVRQPGGEPMVEARVELFRRTPTGVERLPGLLTADDRGQYRAFGLEPGFYYVAARPSTRASARVIEFSRSDVDAALARLARGHFSGPGTDTPSSPVVPTLPLTFYPSSPDVSGASAIDLALGAERSGHDIVIGTGAPGAIRGIAIGPDGPLAGAIVILEPMTGAAPASPTALTATDGTFAFGSVTPGNYWLRGTTRGSPASRSRLQADVALMRVFVDAGVSQQLSLLFSTGRVVTGRVRTPGVSFETVSTWSITARPEHSQEGGGATVRVRLRQDGSFRFEGLHPQRYQLELPDLPAGFSIEAVVDLTAQATVDVEVLVTRRAKGPG